jgi:hypothetical protein
MPALHKLFVHIRIHALGYLIAAGLPVILIIPLVNGMLDRFDYTDHLRFAENFMWPAHFFYHLLLTYFRFFCDDWLLAQFLLLIANYAIMGFSIYAFLVLGTVEHVSRPIVAILAMVMCFVYAIPALYFIDGHMYNGYIALSVYHNPTILLVKPIAVLHFIWLDSWLKNQNNSFAFIFSGAVLLAFSAIAKPSYVVVLLPAATILMIVYRFPLRRFILSIFLPATLILVVMVAATYGGNSGFVVAPFKVISHSTMLWTVYPKLVLSILFPLSLLVMFGRELLTDRLVTLAWLMFSIGTGYGWILAESGERMFHGNWLWSGQIAAFLLFISSTRFLIRLIPRRNTAKRCKIAWIFLFLHFVSGLIWYLVQYTDYPPAYWQF